MTKSHLPKALSALALFALLAGGCQVPDVSNFADATAETQLAIASVGDAVFSMTDDKTSDFGSANPAEQTADLREEWAKRVQWTGVLVAYADAVASVAAAGNDAEETANAVGANLTTVASSVPGYGEAAAQGIAIFQTVAAEIIQAKTVHDLNRIVTKTETAIPTIANLFVQDVNSMRQQYDRILQDRERAVQNQWNPIKGHWAKLKDRRDALLTQIDKKMTNVALEVPPTGGAADPTDAIEARLAQTNEVFEPLDRKHDEYQDALAKLQQEKVAAHRLFKNTQELIRAWGIGHTDMVNAIRDRRRPNIRQLAITVQAVRESLKKIEESRKER